MCGILAVKTKLQYNHFEALDLMSDRGPDFTFGHQVGDVFIGQTVQSFNNNNYKYDNFVFNGEIYNWQDFDMEQELDVIHRYRNNPDDLIGPWAWIYTDGNDIFFASDPVGEKQLFFYEDENITIVASELKPILYYIEGEKKVHKTATKHLYVTTSMFWKGISKTLPGSLYKNGGLAGRKLARLQEKEYKGSYSQAVDDLNDLLEKRIASMTPNEPIAISYSGGLDSSILDTYVNANRYTIVTDKDFVANKIETDNRIYVSPQMWADNYKILSDKLQTPIISWSHVNWYVLTSVLKERILFNGNGADELFGGYPCYLENYSPYSGSGGAPHFLTQLDFVCMYQGTDSVGVHLISGFNSVETRSPYVAKDIVEFAFSLPEEYRVNKQTKVILRDLYKARTGNVYEEPKQGFVGYCEDCVDMIRPDYDFKDWRSFIVDYYMDCV